MKKLMAMAALLQAVCGLDPESMDIPQQITQQHLERAGEGMYFDLRGKQCRILALGMETFYLNGRVLSQSSLDIRRRSTPDMIPLQLTFVDGTTQSATLFITLVQVNQSRKRHADWDPDA
jgi:hypothetical protein